MAKFLTTEGLQTLIAKIKSVEGDLNQLTTSEKTNLVAAINEINAKQPADSADIQALLTLVGSPSSVDEGTPASGLYAKFENLDAEISQTATNSNPLNLSIIQVDGAITEFSGSIADNFFATKADLQSITGLTPEQIETLANVEELVPNSRKIAGIDLADDISADELLSAIECSIHESEEEGCIAVGEGRDVPVHGLGELAFTQGLTIEVDEESVVFNQVVDAENEEEESTAYNFTIEIATAEDITALFD